jgi:hypothetical protein
VQVRTNKDRHSAPDVPTVRACWGPTCSQLPGLLPGRRRWRVKRQSPGGWKQRKHPTWTGCRPAAASAALLPTSAACCLRNRTRAQKCHRCMRHLTPPGKLESVLSVRSGVAVNNHLVAPRSCAGCLVAPLWGADPGRAGCPTANGGRLSCGAQSSCRRRRYPLTPLTAGTSQTEYLQPSAA